MYYVIGVLVLLVLGAVLYKNYVKKVEAAAAAAEAAVKAEVDKAQATVKNVKKAL